MLLSKIKSQEPNFKDLFARNRLDNLWPEDLPVPKNMKFFDKTKYAQRLVILDGQDNRTIAHLNEYDDNPNRQDPWRVSGGMEKSVDWRSQVAISIPGKIKIYEEKVEAGARRNLPKISWDYPVGTIAADMLSMNGRLVEIRVLEKHAHGWEGSIAWKSKDRPAGFPNLKKSCLSCHNKAGTFQSYGVFIRGGDNLFSHVPEGAFGN